MNNIIFPLFKFLKKEYAERLISSGNVRIATLHEFRDEKNYEGEILDSDEGKLEISNTYTRYKGLAKDANGLIPMKFPPYMPLELSNHQRT